ncbi:hypothetical protein CVT24_001831 [Panaeolus cyanescens]|uniref:Uncharacterized protein n=1 Tax=Panaeolus cyanescens TaxID=181874 RepID=A0A409WSB6_9AGAR|nr:hypothetical protein CVT24_001831 [Panaeolus cyanescens]
MISLPDLSWAIKVGEESVIAGYLMRQNGNSQKPSTSSGGPAMMSVIVNIILAMRLYALYGCRVLVRIFLTFLIMIEVIGHIYVITRLGPLISASSFTVPRHIPILGCLSTPDVEMYFTLVAWVPAVVLSLIFFAMMMFKIRSKIFDTMTFAASSRRRARSEQPGDSEGPSPGGEGEGTGLGQRSTSGTILQDFNTTVTRFSPLLKTFWVDGVSSFVLVTASTIASSIFHLTVRGPLLATSQPWLMLVLSISGTRLLLHIREVAAAADPQHAANIGMHMHMMPESRTKTLEPIRFNANTQISSGFSV